VFENRVLRRMFGPKREEVVRGWRRLYLRMRWAVHAESMGRMSNVYKILV
jgi:hypothetical protein